MSAEYWQQMAAQRACDAAEESLIAESRRKDAEKRRGYWAVVLGLRPFVDGNQYCFLWGADIQSGVAGLGRTAEEAMRDFDRNMERPIGPVVESTGGADA